MVRKIRSKPRSFREQYLECRATGIAYNTKVRSPRLMGDEEIIMCDKYKQQCSSKVCLTERKQRMLQLSGWFNNSRV